MADRAVEVVQIRTVDRHAWLAGQIDQIEMTLTESIEQLSQQIDAANNSRDETLRKIMWSAVGLLIAVVTLLADALAGGLVP